MHKKYKRIFVIVADSVGIGHAKDASAFGDEGANTFKAAASSLENINIPNLERLGIGELDEIKGVKAIASHPHSFSIALNETSKGKDTMTGHWEMFGINTVKPFQTFTDTGFPSSLIDELERRTGHKCIGNKSASGTEIIKELGVQSMKENSLIVYTSADSVLQIAANEDVIGLDELYRCCEIAREITMEPSYFVGRVIARPFVGDSPMNFKRVGAHRHDYTVSPTQRTGLDILKDAGYTVSGVGKINDIFNGCGITKTIHTSSNDEGMDETIRQCKEEDFEGLVFVNLVEFDSEFGHRRNPVGYAKCIEAFDQKLGQFIEVMEEEDLLIVTADHGNDPTFKGTDHTREKVPCLVYSKKISDGRHLAERNTFADIGATVLDNFGLSKTASLLGEPIKEVF